MELLEIKKFPSDILREKCEKVEEVDKEIEKLFSKMLYTMRYYQGVGLAAPQVDLAKRIIVVQVGNKVIKLANPEIVSKKGKEKMVEGCLSLPDVSVKVTRPSEIIITGLNEKGEEIELNPEGLLARVLQHEVDHLNGKLIIDYMNFFKRRKYIKEKEKQ